MLSSLAFGSPFILLALLALPLLWWLLRLTPPKPVQEVFPPTRILKELNDEEETPASSLWWLTLLRLVLAAAVIIAMANPIWNPAKQILQGEGRILLLVDNSWSAAPHWDAKLKTANRILSEAQEQGRPVSIGFTAIEGAIDLSARSADDAVRLLAASQPIAVAGNYQKLVEAMSRDSQEKPSSIVVLGNGLEHSQITAFNDALKRYDANQLVLFQPTNNDMVMITNAQNDADALSILLQRPQNLTDYTGSLVALDDKGRILSRAAFDFDEGDYALETRLDLPVELRNQVARIEVQNGKSAGSTYLIDDRFQRRRIGLISGQKNDLAQPLLSPLYYITRALSPFSDIIDADSSNLAKTIPNIIEQKPSLLVLADVGKLPDQTSNELKKWVEEGGTLIRFAGARLAALGVDDGDLLPVNLRRGERKLSGSLTWGEPQKLARFHQGSPFDGLDLPSDVLVKRQVLAEPDLNLDQLTWASLEDGTPLVTAKNLGRGRIILFHVTADASWSNLPLSGSFVEMLRNIVSNSRAIKADGAGNGAKVVGSSRVDLQACKLEYSIVSPK